MHNKIKIAFLGTSNFSVFCLEEMKKSGIIPALIITSPDKKAGRGLKLEVNPVKIWALENKIEFLTPTKLDSDFISQLKPKGLELFLVASYGKIIPKNILDLPKHGTLNIHPSLLPKYRGPSPLQTQILNDEKNIGVSIMQIDEEVDHGPIVAQEKLPEVLNLLNEPIDFMELEKMTAKTGAKLFAKILPDWLAGKIKVREQNHTEATFTKKVEKNDGLLDLEFSQPYENYLKTLAYNPWPGTFFFVNKNNKKIRVIIKESEYSNSLFIIKRILPEGKKEMSYEDFLRGLK